MGRSLWAREEENILLCLTSMLDRVGEARGKGRGGGGEGSPVPSGAWGVGQEHGSFLGDIHLHPSAHLLSASRCQDNLPAQLRRQQGGGEEVAVAPTASSVMEGGGLRSASVLGWGWGAAGARAPTESPLSPSLRLWVWPPGRPQDSPNFRAR